VKAIDGALNESEWSPTWKLQVGGLLNLWAIVLIIVAAIVIIGAIIYFVLVRRRARVQAIPVPEAIGPEIVSGQWRTIEAESRARPRPMPRLSLALPQATKGSKTFSTEQQARLRVIANFAQSLPLVEPGYDADWLLDLVESSMGLQLSPAVHRQLLDGSLSLRYDPAWIRHPLYQDMTVLLEGQPILQDLNGS
jgi:hypothetical protein